MKQYDFGNILFLIPFLSSCKISTVLQYEIRKNVGLFSIYKKVQVFYWEAQSLHHNHWHIAPSYSSIPNRIPSASTKRDILLSSRLKASICKKATQNVFF
jgi:hypothetical protein